MSENGGDFRYGNFEVLTRGEGVPDLLGGGSFGKTYKARHVFLDQVVALKVISEKFAHDKNAKERFLREAKVVHGLRHPHIAQVIDFGEANNTLYYAMEYCEGGSLEDLVKRSGSLDSATVMLLARQLAEALDCSHKRGFIHRDVKPANVMLADKSESLSLKLVDFGLVKPLLADSARMASLTLDGQNFFTPLFASPEQVMEEELDARSDLFSLGMTLWFLLRGGAPETGATAVILAKRLSPDPYHAHLPEGIPAKLRFILRKLLEKDKANRFLSAQEVLEAIDSEVPVSDAEIATLTPEEEDSSASETMMFEDAPLMRLADKYELTEKVGRSALGNIYRASQVDNGAALSITVVDDRLRSDAARLSKLTAAVSVLAEKSHESICQTFGLEEFEDAMVLVREWNGGISLQSIVKSRGSIPFVELIGLLRQVASGVDFVSANGWSGVPLGPDQIHLQPADGSIDFPKVDQGFLQTNLRRWPPFRVRLTTSVLPDDGASDVSSTMGGEGIGSPRVEFSVLIYRLVAGMQLKFAARVDRSKYVNTPNLSEDGNRFLGDYIVEEGASDEGCMRVLQALQRSEGVADVEPGPGETGSTGSRGRTVVPVSPAGQTGSVRGPGATASRQPQMTTGTPGRSPTSTIARAVPPPIRQTPVPPVPQVPPVPPVLPVSTPLPKTPTRPVPPPVPATGTANVKTADLPKPPPQKAAVPPYIPPVTPPVTPAAPVRQVVAPPVAPVPPGPSHFQGDPNPGPAPVPVSRLPIVPIVIGLVAACIVLGGIVLLLRPKPNPVDSANASPVADNTPTPPSVSPRQSVEPVTTPPSTVAPTATPVSECLVRGGGRLGSGATFAINGKTVSTQHRGDDLVVSLSGVRTLPATLAIKVPGFKPMQLTINASGQTGPAPSAARETGQVNFALKARDSDYAYAFFTFVEALPGENVAPEGKERMWSLSGGSQSGLELPTGVYRVTLAGSAGRADKHVELYAVKGNIQVQADSPAQVPVPASFSGRYQGEFDVARVHVTRVITIGAGLNEGTVDEVADEDTGLKIIKHEANNTPLSNVVLNSSGVLMAHIRYAALPNAALHNYDELIELRRATDGTLMMSGGQEMMPDDPAMHAELERTKHGQPPSPSNRPGEVPLKKLS